MLVMESGRLISVSELFANARSPISVAPSGTMTFSMDVSP